jgi:tetratricopeptide (TPR) repeat protein
MTNYDSVCFIIMPFGTKVVEGVGIDFDAVYTDIFAPAIETVNLPEGGRLVARRADKEFFAAEINSEMFGYIEYSRFVLADITGLNANVLYELGARHRTRESGTVIFRQAGTAIPFDLHSIRAFTYEHGTPERDEAARKLVEDVLTASLEHNRVDSPIRLALAHQSQQNEAVEDQLKRAETALHNGDPNAAIHLYENVVALDRFNPLHRMKLGIIQKEQGLWVDAIGQFNAAVGLSERYADAWREKGIAENKLAFRLAERTGVAPQVAPAPGEPDLLRAIELNANDFDAWSSLGGILKRAGRFDEAWAKYRRARELSNDHPYPLLNEIKLRAHKDGKLDLTNADRRALGRAERARALQASKNPPYDSPWCFFDLAEIKLYAGDSEGFLRSVRDGVFHLTETWQARTVLESLNLLRPAVLDLQGLAEGLAVLEGYLKT